jgi:hypothetical protein
MKGPGITCLGSFRGVENTHDNQIYMIQTKDTVTATMGRDSRVLKGVDATFTSVTAVNKDLFSKFCRTSNGDTFLLYTNSRHTDIATHYYGKSDVVSTPPMYTKGAGAVSR